MKYYYRELLYREPINSYGDYGFVAYIEAFKTNSEEILAKMNYKKRKNSKKPQIRGLFHC